MAKHTITLASGNDISYWSHHNDQKPTLILVHGFTGSHEGFQYLVPLLDTFRLIIPDLPGFGVSPLPHQHMTLAEMGQLLVEFVTQLGLDARPHLVGHSMGTLVVAEAARQSPETFAKKLILISPVPSKIKYADGRKIGAVVSQVYYSASSRLPLAGSRIAKSRTISRIGTKLITTTKDKQLKKDIYQHHFNNLNFISSISWYGRLYREIGKTGMEQYASTLNLFDVLLINGARDNVTPLKNQHKLLNSLNAKLYVIPDVGHLSHYEKPEELAQAINSFLQ